MKPTGYLTETGAIVPCIVIKTCRLCKKEFSIAHAAHKHPTEWQNYIADHGSFGFVTMAVVSQHHKRLILGSKWNALGAT